MTLAWVAYLALQLDNSCIVQAQADDFLDDLHMDTNGTFGNVVVGSTPNRVIDCC